MRSNKRLSVLALVVLAAGLSLTACDPAGSTASGLTTSPAASGGTLASGATGSSGATSAPSATSAQDGATSDSNSTSGGSDPTSAAGATSASDATCQTSNLDVSVQDGISGEGSKVINFTNIGDSTCTMHGYAGVDLKGSGSDTAISVPRGGSTDIPTVSLAPGDQTNFMLYYPLNNSGGSGYTFTTMVITPPNETHSTTLSTSINIPLDNPDQGSNTDGLVIYAVGTGK